MTHDNLTPTITAYFERIGGPASAGTIDLFTTDAVVVDDGQTYRGRAQIHDWLGGPAHAFTTTSTQLSTRRWNNTTNVVILLEGDFPGGRVELKHRFTQTPDGRISELHIAP